MESISFLLQTCLINNLIEFKLKSIDIHFELCVFEGLVKDLFYRCQNLIMSVSCHSHVGVKMKGCL